MVEFEREIPFWKALQITFKKYGCEGWGAAFPETNNEFVIKKSKFEKISDTQYRDTTDTNFRAKSFKLQQYMIYTIHLHLKSILLKMKKT